MKHLPFKLRRWLVSVVLPLALWVGAPATVPALPTTVRNAAVDAVALYIPSSQRLDSALAAAGYGPPVAPSKAVLSRMPDIRKIESAYFAAEWARPNRGGAELLAELRNHVAHDAPAILAESALQFLAARKPVPPLPFARPVVTFQKPPSPTWQAIDTLAAYSESGLGSHNQLLVKYFQMSVEEAYEAQRSSDTFADAMQKAYQSSGSNGLKNLRKLARAVVMVAPAIRFDAEVASIFDDHKFPPDATTIPEILGIDDPLGRRDKRWWEPNIGDTAPESTPAASDDLFKPTSPRVTPEHPVTPTWHEPTRPVPMPRPRPRPIFRP